MNEEQRLNVLALVLLWLAGVSLRITILAVPPVLPQIHADLQLSEKAVGALSGLPVLMLALGAVFGSLLLARMGSLGALQAGLALTALAGALRGVGPDIVVLFAMTFAMGLGIAVMQPVMPTLVGQWFRARVGLATAVYINGLLVGEIVAVAFTRPVVLPALGGSWEASLAVWSVPVLLCGLAFLVAHRSGRIRVPETAPGTAVRWWPDWRDGAMWRAGLILGCLSSIYFASNAFLPQYLHRVLARPDLVGPVLTSLNAAQVPASLLLFVWADRFVARRGVYVVMGALSAVSVVGILTTTSGLWIGVWAGAIGFLTSFTLILTLSLPPLFAPAGDVHRFAAAMLAIGYGVAFILPVVSGALWDLTGVPALAFAPIGAAGAVMAALAFTLRPPLGAHRRQPRRAAGAA